jgi:hypothetical protein
LQDPKDTRRSEEIEMQTVEIAVAANKRHQGYVKVKGKRDATGALVTRNGIRWVGC